MKKIFTYAPLFTLFFLILNGLANKIFAQATTLSEGFDNVVPVNWVSINHSTGSGVGWSQGDPRQFNAYTGDVTSYAAAGYQSVGGSSGTGTINNWLISPVLSLSNGATITFYTRTYPGSLFPDRLEVRLSKNGSSINVGSGVNETGDFSTVLLTINPNLDQGGYPDTGWTQYTASLSGISGNISGRVAFRYYVTNAGSKGANSKYIGIDDFSYETVLPVTLIGFTGSIKNNAAVLNWSTASELNNKGFEVQLSHDNKNFSAIGFVAGNGNTSAISQYSFMDDSKMLSGSNYYRLKQIDNDGNYKYSNVVKLDFKRSSWNIFGNPSKNPSIQLQTDAQSNVAVQIVSLNGQVIQTINKGTLAAGTYNIPLNLTNAAHGTYIVRLTIDKDVFTKKIVQ